MDTYEENVEHMPDAQRLKDLLFGRKIVKAEVHNENPEKYTSGPYGLLTLDDGTVLKLWGNDGGCGCSAGCYPLTVLNSWDNAIMNVEVEEKPASDDKCQECEEWWCDHEGFYRIYIVAEDRHLLASFEGTDGNGYYGTGWWLTVKSA